MALDAFPAHPPPRGAEGAGIPPQHVPPLPSATPGPLPPPRRWPSIKAPVRPRSFVTSNLPGPRQPLKVDEPGPNVERGPCLGPAAPRDRRGWGGDQAVSETEVTDGGRR